MDRDGPVQVVTMRAMMSADTYMLYLAAIAIFFASPPDTSQLLIISNSVRHGLRRSGLTIMGDLCANVLQMSAAAFGLAAVIATSAEAFFWLKWAGVAYLAWIGARLLLAKPANGANGSDGSTSRLRLFSQGFITSMANPFAVLFFGALFPQFLDPALPVLPQLLVLGATYLIVDGLILLLWGWLGIRALAGLRSRSMIWLNRVCGALMIAAAALLATKDLAPQPGR